MLHSTFSDALETALQRDIVGQMVIGQYRLSIGSKQGVLLAIADTPVEPPKLRPAPLSQLPAAFPELIGRQVELERARSALQEGQSLEIYGESGAGKSAFLRHLIVQPRVKLHGLNPLFYISQPLTAPEILQRLFDVFYETPRRAARSLPEIGRALGQHRAVIVIDYPALPESQINQIKAALPYCRLIVASRERRFSAADVAIALPPLSLQDAQTLIERELGQPAYLSDRLTLEQHSELETIWRLLDGNPQRLLQAAALVREDRVSLEQTLHYIQTDDPIRTFTRLSLASLPKAQRWIVALLTATAGIGLKAEQIAAMVGPPNPYPSLQSLLQRHLIQLSDDRYSLVDSLADVLQADFNATPWMERAIAHLIPWAETHQPHHDAILEEQAVLMNGLHWTMEQKRWRDGLRLISAMEVALIMGKQWEAWRQTLRWSLKAAWALNDQHTEAWAMHQLGTLAFCQEKIPEAYDTLTEALKIRRANFGNELATNLTRHNLDQIKKTLLPQSFKDPTLRLNQQRTYRALALIGLLVFLISVVIGSTISRWLTQEPPGGGTVNPAPLQK
ncbi:hypothetical protein [Myxacorys almedinensis]|uniref:Uncharacterized protein n=1 Tax=Myxacorys almedinensis A TaxID=2690445 RepID=A0A8J7Z0B1_9CYAN|nr:hypothetical protein [Myxacorys almedinensis]NDJ15773.1 hypothetical protein [Myxacorys almedinensis A]